MKEKSKNNSRKDKAPEKGALPFRGRLHTKLLRSSGFESLPDPVFLIGPAGRIVDANTEAKRLMSRLPAEGMHGSLGMREIEELFARAPSRELAPTPIRVETLDGAKHYEARFAPSTRGGTKAVVFADITIWKRALSEKDAILHAVRMDLERPVTVCARCGSLREPSGEWTEAGAVDSSQLPRERLSHGLCPTCLAAELQSLGLRSSGNDLH